MKTKILAVISVLTMTTMFTACGDNSSSESESLDLGDISIADRVPVEETETAAEETTEETVTLSDTPRPVGGNTGLLIKLPSNFIYNNGWSCWSDIDFKNAVWLNDVQVYETADDLKSSVGNLSDKIKEMTVGDFKVYAAEEPDSFYGAATNYFIDFGKKIGKYEGMRILVTNNDKDMSATQSDIIMQMIQSVTAS